MSGESRTSAEDRSPAFLEKRWLWSIAFSTVGIVAALLAFRHNIDVQQQQLNASLREARNDIVAITDIRRDGRKALIAILERWLAPREQWSTRGKIALGKVAEVVRATRSFAIKAARRASDRDQRAELEMAIGDWSATAGRVIASTEGPLSFERLRFRFDEVDKKCNSIIELRTAWAKSDERESSKLEKEETLSGYATLALILEMVGGGMIQLVRANAAAQIQKSEQARREQELLNQELERRVAIRTVALTASLETTQRIIEAVPFGVVLVDPDGRIRRANDAAGGILGAPPSALIGRLWLEFFRDAGQSASRKVSAEVSALDAKGNGIFVLLSEIPVVVDGEEVIIEAFADLTERRKLETQLRHSQKLESVGQLAAGIAHEINTPAQYVGDSLQFLVESYECAGKLIVRYRQALDELLTSPGHEQLEQELKEAEEMADLEYVRQNAPGAFERAADGIARISSIVAAMKDFAHPDGRAKSPADLNRAIQATLTIARSEYKYVADIETDLGDLPPVNCHIGDINQVILNLIVNAAHAISDVVGTSGGKGRISVRTLQDRQHARIEIADSGAGIPIGIRSRIFDPFFTTKEVGKGSGQGLAIAHSIIVDKHGGALSFESEPGAGTTFTILLPLGEVPTCTAQ